MGRPLSWTISLLLVLLLFVISTGQAVETHDPEISLSRTEESLKPGKTAELDITVTNPVNESGNVTVHVESDMDDWVVLEPKDAPAGRIILINDTSAKLEFDGQGNITLRMKATVPFGQRKGGHEFNVTLLNTENKTQEFDRQSFTLKVKDPESSGLLFLLALIPLLVIFVGIIKFKQPGMRMAIVGWLVAVLVAALVFRTTLEVTLWATVVGLIKSLGITVAVMFTMFLIFLMKETGALQIIAESAKNVAKTKEEQAIFLGIGFGSFLTCLGVVTPALFPPLLVAMGFTPFAAVAIAVLGYDATTSFALLAIPITLPATTFGEDPYEFAYKIGLFLPFISVGLSFAILWVVGGKQSMRKGIAPAFLAGGSLGITILFFTWLSYTFNEVVSVKIMGIFASLITMSLIYLYSNRTDIKEKLKSREKKARKTPKELFEENRELIYALSPWIILVVLVAITSTSLIETFMKDELLGDLEKIDIKGDIADLNIFSQVYTWILIATFLSFPFLKPTKAQLETAFRTWKKRVVPPAVSYSVYFAIAIIMAKSCMEIAGGKFTRTDDWASYNMNNALGIFLADILGNTYIVAGILLGVFGAIAGGSETTSNILFYGVQRKAAEGIGLSHGEFMTLYGGHAVAGGVASAITPAKITNAVSTIGGGKELETQVMRKHLAIVVVLTVVVGLLTGTFITLGI